MECYFGFYKMIEVEMLEAVAVALDADALRWYQWANTRCPIHHWIDLKEGLLREFRSVSGGTLYEQWLARVQTTTVAEYRCLFIEMAAPLDQILEDMLMG